MNGFHSRLLRLAELGAGITSPDQALLKIGVQAFGMEAQLAMNNLSTGEQATSSMKGQFHAKMLLNHLNTRFSPMFPLFF